MQENRGRKGPAQERVLELFDLVRLPVEVVNRYPHELSGGMKQRVMIAMSLVLNPSLVILDEPTSALDVSIQAQMMNLLKDLKRDLGISFIFITHDIALASDLCDRIAVMYGGQIVELGSSEDVFLSPKHPYTQKLLDSIPRLGSDEAPVFISGAPPDLTSPAMGCRFSPRCPFAFEPCADQVPRPSSSERGTRHDAGFWTKANDGTVQDRRPEGALPGQEGLTRFRRREGAGRRLPQP